MAAILAVALSAALSAQTSGPNGSGRRTASIAGRILHPDGAAAEGARVAVYAVREGAPAAIVGTAVSSYDGRYEVAGLPAGKFVVGATPQRSGGFGGDNQRPATMRMETLYPGVTDRLMALPVTVLEGVPAEGIDIWLAPAPQRFSISGRVFWPSGASVEHVVIEYGSSDAGRRGVWHVPDPGGLFTIEGAAQGTYVLLARGETVDGALLGLATTDVTIDDVEDVRIVLRQPAVIEGEVVVDSQGRRLPEGTRIAAIQRVITLSPLYPTPDAAVGPDGRFSLGALLGEYALDVRGVRPGLRIVRATRDGKPLEGNRLVVTSGEKVTGIRVVVREGP